jgi:hypothetical protein
MARSERKNAIAKGPSGFIKAAQGSWPNNAIDV